MSFADQLSNKLFDHAGEQYGMAVQRCIRGLDIQGTDLEKDSFRTRVYQDIFGPLKDHLKLFAGGDYDEIMGEELGI